MDHLLTTLTREELAFYHEQGYVLLRGIVTGPTLSLAQCILERWVDTLARKWRDDELIDDLKPKLPFERRLVELWHDAGQPRYIRSPRRDLVSPEMFGLLSAPELLDVAQDLLGTNHLSVHSIFNARPKLPDQRWTDTPWHQDAQYFRDATETHVPTLWFPLQDVTTQNSCLLVEPGTQRLALCDRHVDAASGFVGLSPQVIRNFKGVPIPMSRGDVLCFHQRTAHAALPNRTKHVRWSMDVRYEDTQNATPIGRELGFVARSPQQLELTSCQGWIDKWRDRPYQTY